MEGVPGLVTPRVHDAEGLARLAVDELKGAGRHRRLENIVGQAHPTLVSRLFRVFDVFHFFGPRFLKVEFDPSNVAYSRSTTEPDSYILVLASMR